MKRAALIILSIAAPLYAAPAPKSPGIKDELTRTVPQCETVSQNAARLLLQNSENAAEVTAEWKNLCSHNIHYKLYDIASRLNEINAASPELDSALWTMMKQRRGRQQKKTKPEGDLGDLLRRTAEKSNPQSDDGKLLKEWFTSGDYALRSELPKYPQSRLYRFFRTELDALQDGAFVAMSLSAGTWFPTGSLATLGNHPTIGFGIFGGWSRYSMGVLFDFRFSNAANDYTFYNPNTNALERTNTFFGLFIAPDFRWEFFRGERFSLFAAAGFGYDLITHYSASRYSRERAAYSESFNFNGGLVLRGYFSEERAGYVELDVRAHRSSYSDGGRGGDTFSGPYFTASLAAGYKINFAAY